MHQLSKAKSLIHHASDEFRYQLSKKDPRKLVTLWQNLGILRIIRDEILFGVNGLTLGVCILRMSEDKMKKDH